MGEIINLRRARKARDRAEKARQADENRLRHGRTKSEKSRKKLEDEAMGRQLDGSRLSDSDDRDTD